MAQTVANLTDVMKQVWTSDRLEKQFYDENPFLKRLETIEADVIGRTATVPIHKGRNGGYTSTGSAGGSLNPAGQQSVDTADYTLVQHFEQIALQFGVLNQSVGGSSSVVDALDLEITGALSDIMRQCTRQVVTNSDGIIAACDTGGASATVELLTPSATAYGYDAIVRGWLYPGLQVDIGATGNTDSIVAGATIVSVKEDATDPDITIDSSVSTTSGTDFVYIANPNSGTAANTELNGLRAMVNTSGAVGGLNPATSGEEFWTAAARDTSTTVLTIDLVESLTRAVHQKTGKAPDYILTSLKQQGALYLLLQNQVRWAGEAKMGIGNVDQPTWAGMEINAHPDVLNTDFFVLTIGDLIRVVGKGHPKPVWMSDISGTGRGLQWQPDTTSFKDALAYAFQIGIQRRNSLAAATGLTA